MVEVGRAEEAKAASASTGTSRRRSSQLPNPPVVSTTSSECGECDEAFVSKLESLRLGLACPEVDAEVRDRLSLLDDAGVEYYVSNASLRDYTVQFEFSRNDYEVRIDGRRVADARAALEAATGRDELVVRLANQSIFADVIAEISASLEPHGLAECGASVCADEAGRYEVYLGEGRSLQASLDLKVAVPTVDGSSKLILATFPCAVQAVVRDDVRVCRSVSRVVLAAVFDDDLKRAAAFLGQAARHAPPVRTPAASLIGPSRILRAAANGVRRAYRSASDRGLTEEVPPPPPETPPPGTLMRRWSSSPPGSDVREFLDSRFESA